MPPSIVELGLHSEPNLELLVQMRPHLIVVDTNQASLLPQLERIAPTFTVDIYDPSRGRLYSRAIAETLRLASRIDREREARAYLAGVEQTLERCTRSIHALGQVPPVLITDLYDDGRHLYVYGSNSMMQDVLDRLGVPNAWTRPTPSGFTLPGIENLAAFTTAQMFFIDRGPLNRVVLHNLGDSRLWNHLPVVANRRVAALPGFFTYGATACAAQFAIELSRALASATKLPHG